MDAYRKWLDENGYDWDEPRLSLGYIKIGQVDIQKCFGDSDVIEIHNKMRENLNITKIKTISNDTAECDYPYTLDGDDWKKIQMEGLKSGYESRSVR